MAPAGTLPFQPRSFDDLGTPLCDVTFCVIDLETTGGSPATCAITEIGAVKVRGGECLGTFQTLVNPGVPIPPEIVVLTGITEAMVVPAPTIGEVLPAFNEFVGGAVLVGHNFRFDTSFLDAALTAHGYPRLGHARIDTCSLARRLVRDEMPDLRLGTLARRLRLAHQPCHRGLDDALATADLLHTLLERAAGLGVLGLDDLLALPTLAAHPLSRKLKLTSHLPRRPGVYLFRGRGDRVLYVGKATDLRSRVRSYFSGDERRKVLPLLREAERVDHVVCASPLEAAVLEVRLIHRHLPPYNSHSTRWRRYAYLKLTLSERFPRLSVVRTPAADGCLYVGPLGSTAVARQVADAIESAVPLRRCTGRPPRRPPFRDAPCTPAQLGVATCPCAGAISEDDYRGLVDQVVTGLTRDPAVLLEPLDARMRELAAAERFEEAAATRDRAGALARALHRQRQFDSLRRAGRLEVDIAAAPAERRLVFRGGLLGPQAGVEADTADPGPDQPVPRQLVDELACVAGWLDAEAARVRLVRCDGELAWPVIRLPRYEPGGPRRQ